MRTMGALGLALLAVCAWPRVAVADGALAVGLPDDVAVDGVAIGWVTNVEGRGEARARSLELCLEFMDAPATTRALCKVVRTFRNECLAVAIDPQAGTTGVGWAVAAGEKAAESDALAACVATAGKARQKACKVTVLHCDGK